MERLERISRCRQELREAETTTDVRRPASGMVVGDADDHQEREADRVAGAVTRALGSPGPVRRSSNRVQTATSRHVASGARGGAVDPSTAGRIRSQTGVPLEATVRRRFEGAMGSDLSAVRVHADSAIAPALGAEAFARGSDIHFAPGRFAPGTSAGDHVLAHELAHVVGTATSAPRTAGGDVIRRSLIGSHAALVAVEQEKGFRFMKTHGSWTDTLQAVAKYEEREAKAPKNGAIKKQRKELGNLRDLLGTIEKHALKWLDAHEDDVMRSVDDNAKEFGDMSAMGQTEQVGVKKMTAIRNLLRRVRWEQGELTLNNRRTIKRDDQVLVGPAQDDVAGGQASRLDKATFNDPRIGAPTTGYYQADAVTAPVADSAAGAIGIGGVDPNWSGRSMAAARLDKLLTDRLVAAGADVAISNPSLVAMDFASHTRTPQGAQHATATTGVFLEEADGAELRGGFLGGGNAVDAEANRANAGQLALDDPVLQRAMNKLQLLDAICGQVDRHSANMFVELDQTGAVTGLQGIDNDMAFGSRMGGDTSGLRTPANDAAAGDLAGGARAWRGLPPIADAAVADAILTIQPEDVRKAIDGLLDEAEVAATISRLAATQTFIRQLPPEAKISAADWAARKQELAGRQENFNSYLGATRTEALAVLTMPAQTVKTNLQSEMVARVDPPAASKTPTGGQVVVLEYSWAEEPILQDMKNMVGKGIDEQTAYTRTKLLAQQYAARLNADSAIAVDRTGMSFQAASKTVDSSACARALESARRMMYAIWG